MDLSTEVTDLAGVIKMPALTIFSMSIKYLLDHARKTLNRNPDTRVDDADIRFVITVPAIWDDKAKLFMREAAVEVRQYE